MNHPPAHHSVYSLPPRGLNAGSERRAGSP